MFELFYKDNAVAFAPANFSFLEENLAYKLTKFSTIIILEPGMEQNLGTGIREEMDNIEGRENSDDIGTWANRSYVQLCYL